MSTRAQSPTGDASQIDNARLAIRRRAKNPKVRTGCITCKIRRVKCDEAKPTCLRCRNHGAKCDGYAEPKPSTRARTLLAAQPTTPDPTSATEPEPQPQLSPPLSPLTFELGPGESWCFDAYRYKLLEDMTPYFESAFWTRYVMLEAMTNDAVRHSVLSLGAMGKAIVLGHQREVGGGTRRPATHPAWPDLSDNEDRNLALKHHLRALALFRRGLGAGTFDPRAAMMVTLLLVAFEAMQGNYHATVSLISSGLRACTVKVIAESFRLVDAGVPGPVPTMRLVPQGIPGQDCVQEMLHIAARYSATTTYLPSRNGKFLVRLKPDEIPISNADTLENCQEHLNYLLPLVGSFAQRAMQAMVCRHAPNPFADTAAAVAEQNKLLWVLAQYSSKLERLRTEPNTVRGVDFDRKLTFLRIHAAACTIMTSGCLDPSEAFYDSIELEFTDLVAEIVALQAMCAGDGEGDPRFCDHVGILPVLSFVSGKCRKPAMRRQVLTMAESYPWREGLWDGKSVANGTRAIAELEQGGVDLDCEVPPENRWAWTDGAWDLKRRTMTFDYIKLLPDTDGTLQTRSITLPL